MILSGATFVVAAVVVAVVLSALDWGLRRLPEAISNEEDEASFLSAKNSCHA